MKRSLLLIAMVLIMTSCADDNCVSCIAQGKTSGIILDHDIACDKSTSFIDGFIDGFNYRFEQNGDTAVVVCERFTDRR